MAGRHGNKGVISRIMPEEDMPYLADGTTVDIVLNPLGVPSRMNVGQVLETHLGMAARQLGIQINEYLASKWSPEAMRDKLKKVYTTEQAHQFIDSLDAEDVGRFASKVKRGVHVATPVFDGAQEVEIKDCLEMAGLNRSAQAVLFDGRSGAPFDKDVTVGVMYVLKLHHLVDDKIHARSIGPYSLRSSLWAAKPSLAASVWERWRFGHWKLMALRLHCRNSSPSKVTTWWAERECTRASSKVSICWNQVCLNLSTCFSKSSRVYVSMLS
jgi:hypothetical protein